MMTDLSRRKIFWLLKRSSSLSLWRRIQKAYNPFFEAVERAVRYDPNNDPNWKLVELYKSALDDTIHFEKGLAGLAVGDRSVFHRHEEGHLSRTDAAPDYILTLLQRGDCTSDWAYLGELARQAQEAYEGASGTLEREDEDEPAAWYATWLLLDQNLPNYAFPEPLPEVPHAPEPPMLVKTGEEVPMDGIYEPGGEGTCMNYLLGGTLAPTVHREKGEFFESMIFKGTLLPRLETIPTTWRLIWADHRYEDGTVPEEEKDYFLPKPKGAVTAPPEATGRALPGVRCSRAGFWYTHAKEGSRRRFEEGEVFPDFPDSAWGATIWYWDEHQGG